jgi:hypothetical protein
MEKRVMNRRIAISLLVLLMFFSLGAALLFILRSGMTPAAPTTQPMCVSIQRGLNFLESRYNPAIGLLNESPVVAPHKYWLTTDNALAAYAFERLGKPGMSETLRESMRRYGRDSNGLIEVLWGVPVS